MHIVSVSASFTSGPSSSCSFVCVCVRAHVSVVLSLYQCNVTLSFLKLLLCRVYLCFALWQCSASTCPTELARIWAARRPEQLHSLLFLCSSKSQPCIKHRLEVSALVSFKDLFREPLVPTALWVFVSRCFLSSSLRGRLKLLWCVTVSVVIVFVCRWPNRS